MVNLLRAALLLLLSVPLAGREWIEYASKTDFFTVNFPGQPTVTDITYMTEYGLTLPARVHSYVDGPNRYSVTMVDYTKAESLHAEVAKKCQDAGGDGDQCFYHGKDEVRGAIVYATAAFLERDAKVTHYANYTADLVEGHRLQLTNADRSRTFAVIHMHELRLYILEGTVAPGAPPPALFQQSLGFLDKDGKRIRYETTYSQGFPVPRRTR